MTDEDRFRTAWQLRARRTRAKANLGWWLARLAPLLALAGLAGFALILSLRALADGPGWPGILPWMSGTLILAAGLTWLLARRDFISETQALVRLESELGLHNALTTAAAGLGPWPQPPERCDDGWRWRWQMIAAPLALFAGGPALALWLPLTSEAAAAPAVQPQAWAKMEDWLEKLREEQILSEEEKQEQQAKIERLRGQEPEKWFSHESLHAGDTLKEQLQREIQRLGQNLAGAEMSLNILQNHADQLSEAARERLLNDFQQALADLKNGGLELDPALLEALASVDPKNLKSLSEDQLKQLRESMKNKAGACEGLCENPGFLGDGEGGDDALAAMLGLLKQECEGDGPGRGGISRGPGTAPLTLADEENHFGTSNLQAVSNDDLSRARVGDLTALRDGKHEVEKNYQPGQSAGSATTGQGGAQVWREALTPAEKAVLKRVFR
ncbi:MAG TPA: hypothetical protein DIT64_14730 [Verrucomicrobiales bacterium]|nr:hypothetical protein [Verrucomicrobiales bacterium]